MTRLLFPIGHGLGAYRLGETGDLGEQVRLGAEIVRLGDEESAVWALAHGVTSSRPSANPPSGGRPSDVEPSDDDASDGQPPAGQSSGGQSSDVEPYARNAAERVRGEGAWVERTPVQRAWVELAASHCGIGDAGTAIDRLLGEGLLAEVDPRDPAATADFARRHRLLPLHIGLGNSATAKQVFGVGTFGGPLAAMPWMLYQLWLAGHLEPNLLAACERRVALARAGGTPGADALDPLALLVAMLEGLHTLLAPSAACLDLATLQPEHQP